MTDPPVEKKVFSIFAPRPKPSSTTVSSKVSPPPHRTNSSESTTTTTTQHASTNSQDRLKPSTNSQKNGSGRVVERTDSKGSECITLDSDDDDDQDQQEEGNASSSTTVPRSSTTEKRVTRGSIRNQKVQKGGKGKAREISIDSDEEGDEDVVILKGSTPKKKKKKDSSTMKEKGKKGKKTVKKLESIDLTDSPPRKPSSTFASSSSFAPLSDLYRQDRERRKVINEGLEPRWPTAEEHGNYLSSIRSTLSQLGINEERRYPNSQRTIGSDKGKGKEMETESDSFLSEFFQFLQSAPLPSPRSLTYKDLPIASTSTLIPTYPSHPLLDRLAASIRSSSITPITPQNSSSELWTSKYGPKKATEVLGDLSGNSAMLLKEWLTELKVAGGIEDTNSKKRRRPINRGIDKKKKKKRRKDGLDDFLASESEEENDDFHHPFGPSISDDDLEPNSDEDDVPDLSSRSTIPSSSSSSSSFHRLTNLILLVGPNGSGKTISVQSVAQELGYEIFEVNSGMGKRRAKDLEHEVGDVGRNHIVRASPKKQKGPNVKDFFAGFNKSTNPSKGKGKESKGLKSPTQSLILIEEVDVLFPGEEDFWLGLRGLAEESRRPIILTCNDPNLIPIDTLGLQKIHLPSTSAFEEPLSYLSFSPPSSSLVIPYLQLIALSEGFILSSKTSQRLYESEEEEENELVRDGEESWIVLSKDSKGVRRLPHPFSNELKREKDLRKCLMQLQFELSKKKKSSSYNNLGEEEVGSNEKRWIVEAVEYDNKEPEVEGPIVEGEEEEEDWLEKAVFATDSISFADSQVSRRLETRIEDLDFYTPSSPSDLELSQDCTRLSPTLPPDHSIQLPYLGREPEFVSSIESISYSLFPQSIKFTLKQDESIEFKKIDYLQSLALLSTQFFYDSILDVYKPFTPFLPSSPSLLLDYLPLYRFLTNIDDEREKYVLETGQDLSSIGGGGGGSRGGVRRSTRNITTTTGGVGGGGGVVIRKEIEWRETADAEFVRKSGFEGLI
ncbi:hypothetical protein JCM3765_007692 [Sporobolomyces pararoseus]